jgi:CMP-N-acetylneuraminic acid synthetase
VSPMIAFLPCRAGSQRVPHKNTRPFANVTDGLLGVKLRQLLACPQIDQVLLSTNDELVINIAESFSGNDKLKLDRRPDHLCSSSTSTDEVIEYAGTIVPEGDLLWTHVTSPLVDEMLYTKMIDSYREGLASGIYDSLMAVTGLRTFLWQDKGPINYDRKVEKWPRTQTLPPLYAVNSAAFLMDVSLVRAKADRIGERPILFELDEVTAFDVDWEEQFHVAEQLYKLRIAKA